jgi:hypothetical protein
MHEVHVELFHDLGMLSEYGRYEGACLKVATPFELEHVTLRANHRPRGQSFQEPRLLVWLGR